MKVVKSMGYRHPRESGGPGQPQRPINRLLPTNGERIIACPWIPAFAGMTTRTRRIGKAQIHFESDSEEAAKRPSRRTQDRLSSRSGIPAGFSFAIGWSAAGPRR